MIGEYLLLGGKSVTCLTGVLRRCPLLPPPFPYSSCLIPPCCFLIISPFSSLFGIVFSFPFLVFVLITFSLLRAVTAKYIQCYFASHICMIVYQC